MSAPTRTHSRWYLRYVMLMTFLVVMVSLMDRYVVSILMEQIKVDLSLTDTQLGWLVGPAFVVVHILSQLPLARLADRMVRRHMIAVAVALWSLFTVAAGFTRNFPQLLVTRMGVGITEAASSPALASMLSDFFGPHRRGLAMSMLSIGGTAGIGAGMLLGGLVGQAYGWRTALIVAGIPGLLLAAVFWLTIKEPARGGTDGSSAAPAQHKSTLEVLRILWANRTYRWLILGASLTMVTSIGRGAWEPVFLMRIYELDQARAGIIYFLISPIPSMVGGFVGGLLIDRLSKRDQRWGLWFPALAMLVNFPVAAAFLLWPTGHTLWDGGIPIGFLFSIAASLIGSMLAPALIATAQGLADANMRAMSHAVWSMAANLVGMGLGPVAAGWLSETLAPDYGRESIRYALLIVSSVGLPAALALWLGARTIRGDLANAADQARY